MAHGRPINEAIVMRQRRLEQLRAQLDTERASFKKQWRDINDYIRPHRGRFFISDRNRGDRRNLKIIDSTATFASRTLSAGMMSGISSPARPWFELGTYRPDQSEQEDAQYWLHSTSAMMRSVFLRSNLYNVLPITYSDVGDFGTACAFVEEDLETVVRLYSFPIGSYMIANDARGKVNVFMREFQLTVSQVVEKFGMKYENEGKIDWTNISESVKLQYETGNTENWVSIVHVVLPNDKYNPDMMESKYKRFSSIYYEQGNTGTQSGTNTYAPIDTLLSERGYDYFPVLAPRWSVTGEDVYGTSCPGMVVIGDVKQLQTGERKSLLAVDKQLDPPMKAPESMKNKKASVLPGDITYTNTRDGQEGFTPVYQVQFDNQGLEHKQEQVRNRIRRGYYEDLFLMIASSQDRQRTAREIDERHEEKLLGLGPMLEQLNQDLFDPLIDITFSYMQNAGMIAPPPPSIEGEELKVKYISIMANAQKLIGLGGIERFTGFFGNVAQFDAGVLDKVNKDELINVYGEMTSLPPGVVVSDEEAQSIRSQREEMARQQQQAEVAAQEAAAAKQLSETNTTDKNALTDILGGGVGTEEGVLAV